MQHQLHFAVNADAHKEPFRGILRQAQDDTDEVGFVGLAPFNYRDRLFPQKTSPAAERDALRKQHGVLFLAKAGSGLRRDQSRLARSD